MTYLIREVSEEMDGEQTVPRSVFVFRTPGPHESRPSAVSGEGIEPLNKKARPRTTINEQKTFLCT